MLSRLLILPVITARNDSAPGGRTPRGTCHTVFEIDNPIYDIVTLFDQSFCLGIRSINSDYSPNFAGMNAELIFRKDKKLSKLYKNYGNLDTISVPEKYDELWKNINETFINLVYDNNHNQINIRKCTFIALRNITHAHISVLLHPRS